MATTVIKSSSKRNTRKQKEQTFRNETLTRNDKKQTLDDSSQKKALIHQ